MRKSEQQRDGQTCPASLRAFHQSCMGHLRYRTAVQSIFQVSLLKQVKTGQRTVSQLATINWSGETGDHRMQLIESKGNEGSVMVDVGSA
jgi:hypothetical protein